MDLLRNRRDARRSQHGQTLIVFGLMAVVLFGFAGLALDAGHLFLVHRNVQNAADGAALAAGKRLSGTLKTVPPDASSTAVKAAHDVAAGNGFVTTFSSICSGTASGVPRAGLTQFFETWYDTTVPCGATSGWNTQVAIFSPPQTLVGSCTTSPYNCIQITITQRVQNYLMGVLGQPVTVVSAFASVFSQPTGTVFAIPAPVAVYLYQPQLGCGPLVQQCFDETKPPTRSMLDCRGTQNCPTFWTRAGSNPLFTGIDSTVLSSLPLPGQRIALESNGDMVIQDPTTICDPSGGLACTHGAVVGTLGFAIAPPSPPSTRPPTLYCSSSTPVLLTPTPCTAAGPGGAPLASIAGNETTFYTNLWLPVYSAPASPLCGSLVLNGDTVASALTRAGGAAAACYPKGTDPTLAYTIQPGTYNYIVINHGAYDFEAGLYIITGKAPTNGAGAGLWANGIDHSGETAADWDLCTTAVSTNPLSCSTAPTSLTAGVWIGHASATDGTLVGAFAPTAAQPCEGGAGRPIAGGGGDATRVTGMGVTFRFESGSAGFVATHEVDFIGLVGPGLGQQLAYSGTPMLFDMENPGFIHLDADGDDFSSFFKGLIYQTQSANAGGVELNPGLANLEFNAAVTGQIWAYSLTTFGTTGRAVDFSKGFGTGAAPELTTAGEQEPEILVSAQFTTTATTATLKIEYDDEWALDAYSAFVKVNNNAAVYFSEGLWVPNPPTTSTLPPNPNGTPPGSTPSDVNPARPALGATQNPSGRYTPQTTFGVAAKPDWTMTWPAPRTDTFRVYGDWVWGHEQSIAGASSGTNQATLIYTFPKPATPTVTITLFMADGDDCGDWVTATWTFSVPGAGAGAQDTGSVLLVQ